MKTTIQINIGNTLLHLDEDAYLVLSSYLKKIEQHFSSSAEGKEIIADIESRIAELLQMKLTSLKQVICIDDVNEAIEIMGKPEDIYGEPEPEEPRKHQRYSSSNTRRLYRDLDHNIIAGVCSGLGIYFDADPVIFRILFIVLSIPMAGFPALLYLVMWIVVPAALTTAQKVEMRGGKFNIADIEQSVKQEFENVKENFKRMKDSDGYKRSTQTVNHVGRGLGDLILLMVRIFLVLVGVGLVITGISLIVSIFGVYLFSDTFIFWNHPDINHFFSPDFLNSLVRPENIALTMICLAILIGIPILSIIYWGLKLILRFKANDRILSLIALIAWILSIIILFGISMFEIRDVAISTQIEDQQIINLPQHSTLYITSSSEKNEYSEIYLFDEGMNIYTRKSIPNRFYVASEIDFVQSESDQVEVKIEKKARGISKSKALENIENLDFHWNLNDTVLSIDPVYCLNSSGKLTFPELELTVYLPKGQKVYIDKTLANCKIHSSMDNGYWEESIPGHTWKMTSNGLEKSDIQN